MRDRELCENQLMPPPVHSACVELGQLRELLQVDRHSAGEARQAEPSAPLKTIAYSKPWRVKLKRRWRGDRRLRVRCWSACLVLAALTLLWLVGAFRAPAALAGEPRASTAAKVEARGQDLERALPMPLPAAAPAAQTPASLVTPSQPTSADGALPLPGPAPNSTSAELSPRRRLMRADVWLRVDSERGAQVARALLESALAELPDSAHGQAALAEACRRLGDQSCARAAIDKAKQARPWRAGYRVLSRRIDAAFAHPQP